MSVQIRPYVPKQYVDLPRLHNIVSAWAGLDRIMEDVTHRFEITQGSALEFGVEGGYSTVALANLFQFVTGVDTFVGDPRTGSCNDHFASTSQTLSAWPNIYLYQAKYQDWIKADANFYNLIHVDIVHVYDETYECGEWALQHSPFVMFHDSATYPDVMRACVDLAEKHKLFLYQYPENHGLAMLSRQECWP